MCTGDKGGVRTGWQQAAGAAAGGAAEAAGQEAVRDPCGRLRRNRNIRIPGGHSGDLGAGRQGRLH